MNGRPQGGAILHPDDSMADRDSPLMRTITDFDLTTRPARAGLIIAVLTVFSVISTGYGWFKSPDARAWWPFILLLQFAITYIYAVAYVLLTHNRRLINASFLIPYHASLGAVLFLRAYLDYAVVIDRVGASGGFVPLSVEEGIVQSPKTYYAIHLVFLSVAVIWSHAAREAGGPAHSEKAR